MGEIVALALKFGAAALPLILTEHGIFAALFAFFALIPLGHFTIGVLLVILGVFIPKLPDHGRTHAIKLGQGHTALNVNGSARTVLLAVGALVIAGSFFEAAR